MALRNPARRRTADRESGEVTAVSTVNLNVEDDREQMRELVRKSRSNARLSWKWYEAIGEVHKAISRSARIAGYARLRAVTINPDGSDGADAPPEIQDIVRSIYSPYGGVRGLIDRYFTLMKVPGESWLVRCRNDDGTPDGYHLLSADEIDEASLEDWNPEQPGDVRWITLPAGAGVVGSERNDLVIDVPAEDVLGRVFLPGRRWVNLPDSPLKALRTECDVLYSLTLSMKARIRQRFVMAGILGFPSEINEVIVAGRKGTTQDILNYVVQAMTTNVQNWEDATTYFPILVRGHGDALQQITTVTFDNEVFEQDIKFRSELIDRILFGLDIHTDATKGSKDTNHWGAWAQSDEEVRVAIQPDLDNFCWAMTRLVLHPEMERLGFPTASIRMAWDMSESAARTNRQEDTRQAHDLGLASGDAVMRVSGLNLDEDRMTIREYVRWVGRMTKNPYFMLFDGETLDEIDWDEAKKWGGTAGPAPDSPSEDSSVGPGVGDPGSPGNQDGESKQP